MSKFLSFLAIYLAGCSFLSDSEFIMRTTSEIRKPSCEYISPEEKPIDYPLIQEKSILVAPQVGIRIPLGK